MPKLIPRASRKHGCRNTTTDRCMNTAILAGRTISRARAATYFVRVSGESMTGAGIFDGSLLLVDSSIRPQHNDIIIACLGGEFTVKRYVTHPRTMLLAENLAYPPIELYEGEDLETFGVVKFVINEAR